MFKHFIAGITSNLVSLIGTVLVIVSALLMLTLFVMQSMGFEGSSYLGILTYVLLPLLFIAGLALVPMGLWWQKRKDARAAAQGLSTAKHFPVVDFNKESTRGLVLGFVLLAIPTLAVVAGLSFKAIHYMDSDEFCGTACHTVMEPEYTAYQRSPHARVGCAGCHIGPGAEWFVKAKISGSWQLIAVAFDLYPRADHDAGALAAPLQRHLRAVPLAHQVRRRTPQGAHAFRRGRAEHRTQDGADGEGRRQGRQRLGRHPLARRPEQLDPLPRRPFARDDLRDRADRQGRQDREVQDRNAGARRCGMAHDGLRRLPQPSERTSIAMPEHEIDLALVEGRIDRSLPFVKREGLRLLKRPSTSRTRLPAKGSLAT